MIITITKRELPKSVRRSGAAIRQKNRVRRRISFHGFPKRDYADFSDAVRAIVKDLRKLNSFCLEGILRIRVENHARLESGCLHIYNVDERSCRGNGILSQRLCAIKEKLDKICEVFPGGYELEFKLWQWLEPVKSSTLAGSRKQKRTNQNPFERYSPVTALERIYRRYNVSSA